MNVGAAPPTSDWRGAVQCRAKRRATTLFLYTQRSPTLFILCQDSSCRLINNSQLWVEPSSTSVMGFLNLINSGIEELHHRTGRLFCCTKTHYGLHYIDNNEYITGSSMNKGKLVKTSFRNSEKRARGFLIVCASKSPLEQLIRITYILYKVHQCWC